MDLSLRFPNTIIRSKVRTKYRCAVSNELYSEFAQLFPNQVSLGARIADKFEDRSVHSVLAIALTQSGKTGSMLSTIHHFLSVYSIAIPIQHVFIITGHSSVDWIQQTKDRFPESLHSNIFHRNKLDDFVEAVSDLTNVLIFIDETQIACKANQCIQKAFARAGFDEKSIYSRDIKFVHVSATPSSVVKKFIPITRGHDVIFMDPAPSYRSIFDLVAEGRVFQYKDLCGFDSATLSVDPVALDNIREISPFVSMDSPKYHIIRTHHSFLHDVTVSNFKKVFLGDFEFITHSDADLSSELDSILSTQPSCNTFIFIKERLRCATTIPKMFLGVLYERHTGVTNDFTIIQGLAGRATGYHSYSPVIFSNLFSIRRYQLLWAAKFFL